MTSVAPSVSVVEHDHAWECLSVPPRRPRARRRSDKSAVTSAAPEIPLHVRFAYFVGEWRILPNTLNPLVGFSGFLHDTAGSDLDAVRRFPPNRVWTLVISAGLQSINPGFVERGCIGYFVAERAFDPNRLPQPIRLY